MGRDFQSHLGSARTEKAHSPPSAQPVPTTVGGGGSPHRAAGKMRQDGICKHKLRHHVVLGEMTDSGTGEGDIQGEPGAA